MLQTVINIIEILFAMAIFDNAALFVPQACRIYKHKDGSNLSLLTFGGFFVIQVLTALHAIINNDMILLYGYILSLIACGTVIFLALRYRSKPKNVINIKK